jgi:hypothetical protein
VYKRQGRQDPAGGMKVLDAIRLGVEKAEAVGICVAMAVADLRGEVMVI